MWCGWSSIVSTYANPVNVENKNALRPSSYKAFMKRNKNFSAQQINKCLCWLSKLVYLAVDYGILRANLLEDMEYEKKPAPKHRHISRAELKAILETPMLDPLHERLVGTAEVLRDVGELDVLLAQRGKVVFQVFLVIPRMAVGGRGVYLL